MVRLVSYSRWLRFCQACFRPAFRRVVTVPPAGRVLFGYVEQVASLPDYPTSFPPTSHGHDWGDLTSGVPTEYNPSAHTHEWTDLPQDGEANLHVEQIELGKNGVTGGTLIVNAVIGINKVYVQNDNNSDASLSYPAPLGGVGTFCCSLNTDGTPDVLQYGTGGHYTSISADSIVIGVLEQSRWRTALGAGTAGKAVFVAETQGDAQDAVGATAVGKQLITAANAAAAATAAGVGTTDTVTHKKLALTGGSIAASTPNTITQTWTGTGTYEASVTDITDSGPANAASTLADWKVNGVSKCKIKKDGTITIPYISNANAISFASGQNGFHLSSEGQGLLIKRGDWNPVASFYQTVASISGYLSVGGSIRPGIYTVATTPSTAATGMVTGAIILITDAEAPAIGSAVASGAGTDHLVACQYNGSAWIVTAILT